MDCFEDIKEVSFKILAMFDLSRQLIIASKDKIHTGLCVINKQACLENYFNILRVVDGQNFLSLSLHLRLL